MKDSRNLIESLGRGYMNDWFNGAYFAYKDKLHQFMQATSTGMICMTFGTYEESEYDEVIIPAEEVRGFSFFKFPPLGYRMYNISGKSIVVNTTSGRSARRGLSRRCVSYEVLPAFTFLQPSLSDYLSLMSESDFMRGIFFPRFTPFHQGIKGLQEAKSAGFAVNEDVAVALNVEARGGNLFDLLYRGRKVGSVSPEGEVNIHNKFISRSVIKEALL